MSLEQIEEAKSYLRLLRLSDTLPELYHFLRVCRAQYYVYNGNTISDREYDILERYMFHLYPNTEKLWDVGCSLASSYTEAELRQARKGLGITDKSDLTFIENLSGLSAGDKVNFQLTAWVHSIDLRKNVCTLIFRYQDPVYYTVALDDPNLKKVTT